MLLWTSSRFHALRLVGDSRQLHGFSTRDLNNASDAIWVSGREQVTRWREWLWIGLLIDFVLEAWLFDAFVLFSYSHELA